MRAALLSLALAGLPQIAGAQTALADYAGTVPCSIERICQFEQPCHANDWQLSGFTLDFRTDGQVTIAFGDAAPTPMAMFLPRPAADNAVWWNFAWMTGGPNLLQIGDDGGFMLIQGPVEQMGPDEAPPIIFTGACTP